MASNEKVTPGTPLTQSPARSATWLNSVTAAKNYYQQQVAAGQVKPPIPGFNSNPAKVTIKNITEEDLQRGHCVQLGDEELTDIDSHKPWFEADKPTAPLTDKIAIVRNAIKDGERGAALTLGVMTALVNVTNIEHTHATPVDDEVVMNSTGSGTIRILSTLTETGEQEVWVLLGPGSAPQKFMFPPGSYGGASWDDGTSTDTPTTIQGYPFSGNTIASDAALTDVENGLGASFTVGASKGRRGWVLGGKLIALDCPDDEVTFTPPEEE